jgi:hypothetical protein
MWKILLFLVPVFCFAECAQIGVPTIGRIQGTVVNVTEEPVAGATIEVYQTKPGEQIGNLYATASTNKTGRFSLRKKDEGLFILRVVQGDTTSQDLKVRIGDALVRRSGGQNLILTLVDEKCVELAVAP